MFHIVLIFALVTIPNRDRWRCRKSSPTQILQGENIKCFILFWSLHLLPFRTVTDEGAEKVPPPRYCRREHKMFHIVLIFALVTIPNRDRWRCRKSSPHPDIAGENIKCFILFWSLHLLPFRTVTDEGAEKVSPPRYRRREHKMFHIVLIFALVAIPNCDRWRCRKSSPTQILQQRT